VQDARARAEQLHARVKLGEDPAGQKIETRARAVETFGSVLQPFLKHKKADLKPRTYVEVERHLLVNAKRLHGLQIDSIDRRTVATLLAELARFLRLVNAPRSGRGQSRNRNRPCRFQRFPRPCAYRRRIALNLDGAGLIVLYARISRDANRRTL
jgi:hypothetical protein